MIRISKLTDYATIIMSYLALEPTQVFSAAEISKAIHITTPTVSKILKILAEAELILSYRGAGGGYQLARLAQDITLADIVSALEGSVAMTECCSAESLCSIDSLCTLKTNWKTINTIIFSTLASVTLKNMMQPLTQTRLTLKGIPIVKGF